MELERFVEAQEHYYSQALEEIRGGRKWSHWIWFIFPQLKSLGKSRRAKYYGIEDAEEAKAYLAHPLLGTRLREITTALLRLPEGYTARGILGDIDALKVRSSMTLFYAVSKENLFLDVLNRYYDGKLDNLTTDQISITTNQ